MPSQDVEDLMIFRKCFLQRFQVFCLEVEDLDATPVLGWAAKDVVAVVVTNVYI